MKKDSLEYIRSYYGVPAEVGGWVEIDGRLGTKMTSLLFHSEMAIAYRLGLKTQTRRIKRNKSYGEVGDRVVLRTTWATEARYDHLGPTDLPSGVRIWSYFDSDEKPAEFGRLRPGLFLPLRFWDRMPQPCIVSLREEPVQKLTTDDAIAEGVDSIEDYVKLWDSINSDRGYSWKYNPGVYVIGLQPWKEIIIAGGRPGKARTGTGSISPSFLLPGAP